MEFAAALDIYDAVLQQFPEDFPQVYVDRADILGMGIDAEGAIADYTKALALDPEAKLITHTTIWRDRGEVSASIGDYEAAIADFDRVLAAEPDFTTVFFDRGEAKLTLEDCSGAAADFTSAVTSSDDPSVLYYEGRATAHICLGKMQDALDDLRESIARSDVSDADRRLVRQEYLTAWAVAVRLGQKDDADRRLAEQLTAAAATDDIDLDADAARWFLGQSDEAALFGNVQALNAKGDDGADSWDSYANYYAGLKRLADGDVAAARAYFEKVLEARETFVTLPELSRSWIKEIERNPDL